MLARTLRTVALGLQHPASREEGAQLADLAGRNAHRVRVHPACQCLGDPECVAPVGLLVRRGDHAQLGCVERQDLRLDRGQRVVDEMAHRAYLLPAEDRFLSPSSRTSVDSSAVVVSPEPCRTASSLASSRRQVIDFACTSMPRYVTVTPFGPSRDAGSTGCIQYVDPSP